MSDNFSLDTATDTRWQAAIGRRGNIPHEYYSLDEEYLINRKFSIINNAQSVVLDRLEQALLRLKLEAAARRRRLIKRSPKFSGI